MFRRMARATNRSSRLPGKAPFGRPVAEYRRATPWLGGRPMSRRSTPERIDTARRQATLARLVSAGELPEKAEAWVTLWEAQAASDGTQRGGAFWDAGWAW